MTRPRYLTDVKNEDRFYEIARVNVAEFSTIPSVLKHYTAMVDAVQKLDGRTVKNYSTTVLSLKKDREQLSEQLKMDQERWDRYQKLYKQVISGEEIPNYNHSSVKEWAKNEDLPDPFETSTVEETEAEVS